MTAPKLWSERDFDECCYPVSGEGRFTMVCAVVGRGSYCEAHRKELAEECAPTRRNKPKVRVVTPARPPRIAAPKPPKSPRPLPPRPLVKAGPSLRAARLEWLMARVARKYRVSADEVIGPTRWGYLIPARQEFFYLAHHAGYSYPVMGRFCGGRDHSTAWHGKIRHEARLAAFEATRLRWDEAA